jgi:hypothetical protein
MASFKRSRRHLQSSQRKWRYLRPLLENLEDRVVLSFSSSALVPPNLLGLGSPGASLALTPENGLIPVPLANGGTAWLQGPKASAPKLPTSTASHGTANPPEQQPAPFDPGVILGQFPVASPFGSNVSLQTPGPSGFIPQQIQTAYGLSTGSAYNNNIPFGAIKGDGNGQTIGIFEEGYNPAFVDTSSPNYSTSALAVFDKTFGLPDPPSLTFVDHTGTPLSSTNNSTNNPDFLNYGAGDEIALDIEWAHAMAPGAEIDVLCATPLPFNEDTVQGMATLAGLPGVSVVSASYGFPLDLFGQESLEQNWDSTILQPAIAAHPNVSFFAASGDDAAFEGLIYPSASPEVVSVGGTSLFVTRSGQWSNEVAWDGSGGGFSQAFAIPSYQQNDGFSGNNGMRTNPDVAADADPATGVAVYDPFDFGTATPWVQLGGTSLATPLWAGMAAIADQGRVLAGGKPLGATQMLTDLYSLNQLAPGDFHDITQGNNFIYSAGPGYDLVTGLGTPKANLLLPDLAALGQASQAIIVTQPPPSVVTGDSFGIIAAPADSLGATDFNYTGVATLSLVSGPAGASFTPVSVLATKGMAVFDDLALSKKGTYVFQVSMTGLTSTTTNPVAVIAPTAGVGNFYPLPFDSSLRAAVNAADFNTFAVNIITLSISSLPYVVSAGQLLIDNTSGLPSKALTIVGQGESSSVIDAGGTSRVFEIMGSNSGLLVAFQSLAIEGGDTTNDAGLGLAGNPALGGGLLIDGGTVSLTTVALMNNAANGAAGASGATGQQATKAHPTGGPGGNGGNGDDAPGWRNLPGHRHAHTERRLHQRQLRPGRGRRGRRPRRPRIFDPQDDNLSRRQLQRHRLRCR